jgi:hypothetical protein
VPKEKERGSCSSGRFNSSLNSPKAIADKKIPGTEMALVPSRSS